MLVEVLGGTVVVGPLLLVVDDFGVTEVVDPLDVVGVTVVELPPFFEDA